MPTYVYRCEHGHVSERVHRMSEIPAAVQCLGIIREPTDSDPPEFGGQWCGATAARIFTPLAAIHFKGSGFYSTDVNGAQRRRRRPNPGDDMPRSHDAAAAAIARSL